MFKGKSTLGYFKRTVLFIITVCAFISATAQSAEDKQKDIAQIKRVSDIVIADFENGYANWTLEGTAFGANPASGKIGGQQEVSGFEGVRLANSFKGGDGAVGKIKSAPFKIEKRYLSALLGGGADFENLYLRVLLENGAELGRVGGANSETLVFASLDLGESNLGKTAYIEIADFARGSWGHINADYIILSDEPRGYFYKEFTLVADKPFLLLPVKNSAAARPVLIAQAQNPADIILKAPMELDFAKPDWLCALDISKHLGKALKVILPLKPGDGLPRLKTADKMPLGNYPNEALRPQYHFSAPQGWLNDPNGLVYFDGLWHLYYQLTPYSVFNGNKYWGYAVSKDLIRWEHKPIALSPRYRKEGGANQIYSGTAYADAQNKSGLFDAKGGIIYAFTYTGLGDFAAYSKDGADIKILDEFPVTKERGRDPCIFYFEKTQSWTVLRYEEYPSQIAGAKPRRCFAFYVSKDLKQWRRTQVLEDFYECPCILPMAVNGDEKEIKYIIFDARGETVVGDFDGERFTQEGPRIARPFLGAAYAGQLWRNAPNGRAIQITWLRQNMQLKAGYDMPFSQIMTLPYELALKRTDNAYRISARPVEEIETLYKGASASVGNIALDAAAKYLDGFDGDAVYIDARFEIAQSGRAGLKIGDVKIEYEKAASRYAIERPGMPKAFIAVPNFTRSNIVRAEFYIDRSSLEIIHQGGEAVIALEAAFKDAKRGVAVFGEGASLVSAKKRDIASAFEKF